MCSKIISQTHKFNQEDGIVDTIFEAWNSRPSEQSGYDHTLLYFAVTYGMITLCSRILKQGSIEQHMSLRDSIGFTLLQTAVFCGQTEVTQLLLSYTSDQPSIISGDLLHIALRREDDAMVRLLASNSIGLSHKSITGETCMHIATQLGREDYILLLLKHPGPDLLDVAEITRQWTPLFVACVQGYTATAKLLLEAGADTTRIDYNGWTAQEHAAFRGHIPVAELFLTIRPTIEISQPLTRVTSTKELSCFDIRRDNSHVILNLGGLQDRQVSEPSTLKLSNIYQDGLNLRISTSESDTSFDRLVPLLDDPVDDTFVFPIKDPSTTMLIFTLYKRYSGKDGATTLIGSGVTSLYAQVASLGSRHATLVREHSIPILRKDTLKIMGTISFSFLVVKPYQGLISQPPGVASVKTSSVQLIGHRGNLVLT